SSARRIVRAVRALWRIDPLGVQYGTASDGSARPVSRPRLRRGARVRHVDVFDLELSDRGRARSRRMVAAHAGVYAGSDVLYSGCGVAGDAVAVARAR